METSPKELLEGDVFIQDGSGWVAGPHAYDAGTDGTITLACYKMPDYEARKPAVDAAGNALTDDEGQPRLEWVNQHEDNLTMLSIFEHHPVDVIRNVGQVVSDREGSPAGKLDVPLNSLSE